ncbi:MAG: hypothetical protein ACI8TP_001947 [Acidimicrobiales bacterium]
MRDQDVLGLDVAVTDADRMGRLDGATDGIDDVNRVRPREWTLATEAVSQRAARRVLKDQVSLALCCHP